MEEDFNNIRVFLFKELKKIATIKKNEKLGNLDFQDKIYAMEKIAKMLKETIGLTDNEIDTNKAHMKSVEEEINEDPFR